MDGKGLGTGAGVDLFGDPVRVACPSCDGRGAHPVSGQTRYHQDGGVYRPTGSTPCPRCQRGPPRNSAGSSDRDLVVSVLRTALGDGYAVIGHPMRVYRCAGRGEIEEVPRYESDMVSQLLDQEALRVGGWHEYTCGSSAGRGRSVIVPRATRTLLNRWAALQGLW
jgi:hypothetical protein